MYNRYICPLQAYRHLTFKIFIQGHPWSARLPHVANFKSSCISFFLIIGPRGLACKANLYEIMGRESSDVAGFDLGSLLHGQTRIAKVKSLYNLLIYNLLVLEF